MNTTNLLYARFVVLLLEEYSRPVGYKRHVGPVECDGLAISFECLREFLSDTRGDSQGKRYIRAREFLISHL